MLTSYFPYSAQLIPLNDSLAFFVAFFSFSCAAAPTSFTITCQIVENLHTLCFTVYTSEYRVQRLRWEKETEKRERKKKIKIKGERKH